MPSYGALRIRTEFVQPARSLVGRGVVPGTIIRWPVGCANRPGRVVDPLDALYFLRGGERPERRLQAEGSVDLLDEAGNSARIEIVISAPRGAA